MMWYVSQEMCFDAESGPIQVWDGMYSPPFSSVSPSPYLCWESGVTAGNWSKGEQEIQFCKKILNLPTHYFKKYFNHDQNIPENEVNTCIS